MAGYRDFQTGEVLTAANVNDFLMDQSVMKFADASARDSALGTAVGGSNALREGMVAYLDSDDVTQVYDGAAWISTSEVALTVEAAGSDTIALDFSTGAGFVTRTAAGTAVSITGSNYTEGATRTVRLIGGAAAASLSVPADWTFVGSAAGTALGTAVAAVITATCFGTAATDVIAAYAEQA